MASTDDGAFDLLTVRPLRLPAELVKLRRISTGACRRSLSRPTPAFRELRDLG